MRITLFILIPFIAFLGCNSRKKNVLPYELDSISVPRNGLKVIVVDSTYQIINTGKISLIPPEMEIGTLDISHHFPKYSFNIASTGRFYISDKKKNTLKIGNKSVSEGYYINGMCLCKFSTNNKLVILKKGKYDCEIIKKR